MRLRLPVERGGGGQGVVERAGDAVEHVERALRPGDQAGRVDGFGAHRLGQHLDAADRVVQRLADFVRQHVDEAGPLLQQGAQGGIVALGRPRLLLRPGGRRQGGGLLALDIDENEVHEARIGDDQQRQPGDRGKLQPDQQAGEPGLGRRE